MRRFILICVCRKSAGKASCRFLKNHWAKIMLALIIADVVKKESMFLLARNMYALIRRPGKYSTGNPHART
jgi:hypothetical protein